MKNKIYDKVMVKDIRKNTENNLAGQNKVIIEKNFSEEKKNMVAQNDNKAKSEVVHPMTPEQSKAMEEAIIGKKNEVAIKDAEEDNEIKKEIQAFIKERKANAIKEFEELKKESNITNVIEKKEAQTKPHEASEKESGINILTIIFFPIIVVFRLFALVGQFFFHLFSGSNIAPIPIATGVITILAFFGIFGFWAYTAPIDSAAVASGTVVFNSSKQVVQHLEGGIVKNILVKNGDYVMKGQTLLELDETNAFVNQNLVNKNLAILELSKQRLISERDDKPEMEYNEEMLSSLSEQERKEVITNEKKLFESRRRDFLGKVELLEQKREQFTNQTKGLLSQKNSAEQQLDLINEEITSVQILLEDGSATKPRLLSLQRKAAELKGFIGEYNANVSKVKESLIENDISINNLRNEYMQNIFLELKNVNAKISDLQERGISASDILDRIVIKAPEAGIVNNLKRGIGSVVGAGEPILEIVPKDDKLIVEAKISVKDIDIVYVGLPAKVRITSFRTRQTPLLEGHVTYVSPDKVISEDKNVSDYYTAKIEITNEELIEKNIKVGLYPGMSADVFVVTGSRTLLDYLMNPITSNIYKSFREE